MPSKNSHLIRRLPWRAIGRWWGVGLSFYVGGLVILYICIGMLKVPLLMGTLVTAETTTIIRYCINDRWVFEEKSLSWKRFWQYHVANAGGFAIWWAAVNTLPMIGVHYLIASTIGTGCSVLSTMATNFLWIWRKRSDSGVRVEPVAVDSAEQGFEINDDLTSGASRLDLD